MACYDRGQNAEGKGFEGLCGLGDLDLDEVIDRLYASRDQPFDRFREQVCSQPGSFLDEFVDLLLKRAAERPEPSREEAVLAALGLPILGRLEWHIYCRFVPKLRLLSLRVLLTIAERLNDREKHLRVFESLMICDRMMEPGPVEVAVIQAIDKVSQQHRLRFKPKSCRTSGGEFTGEQRDPARPPAVVMSSNRPVAKQSAATRAASCITVSSNQPDATKPPHESFSTADFVPAELPPGCCNGELQICS
jgi:hypothetical protein